MKILLIGEYSNVHNTLAQGLRHLGHEVMVASNGDGWKNYPRDINLGRIIERKAGLMVKVRNAVHLVQFLARLLLALPRMRGYDVVQVINPDFIELKASRTPWLYRYLRRHNKRVVLGAYGDDYYLVDCMTKKKPLRYSDYNRGEVEIFNEDSNKRRAEWLGTSKERMTRYIASDCDAIIAGAYEYWVPYSLSEDRDARQRLLRDKLHLVPMPVVMPSQVNVPPSGKLRVFIGISRGRSVFKGTDIMLRVAEDLLAKYPDKMELLKAEGVPFDVYQTMMDSSDVLLDQIYAYGPGMNALLAMSKGMIVFSGGEPEHYDSMGEVDCRPIINVTPSYDDVYSKLETLVLMPKSELQELKRQSREYVVRNHDSLKVARRMEAIYASLLK